MKLPYVLIGLALALFGAFIRVVDPSPLPQLREAYFDALQKAAPREAGDFPIEIVAIDEASLSVLGQWPWPRSILAQLTDALNDAGAAVVAYDVLFAEPDRYPPAADLVALDMDNDQAFAEAIWAMPTVLATGLTTQGANQLYDKSGFVTIGQPANGAAWPADQLTGILPPLLDAAEGVGVISTSPLDTSGIVRQVPLVWNSNGLLQPSFGLEALRVALGEGTYFVTSSPDLADSIEGVGVGDFFFPTDSNGSFRMRYAHEDPTSYISASDVLNWSTDQLAERVAGKIIFVGASAPGLLDIRTTALGETVPGVTVHKQVIEQVFAGSFLIRTDYQSGLEILIFLLLGIVVAVAVSLKNSFVTVVSGAGAAGIICLASYFGFTRQGVLLDITFPLIGGMLNFALMGGYQFVVMDRDKRLLRKSFEHYVAPSVLDEIEKSGHDIGLGGTNKDITVMFADIRGFTAFSEERDPQQVVSLLNDLFTRLTDQVLAGNGTVDKYVGDALMAFWGAPIETPDHEVKAVRAALGLRETLRAFNAEQETRGLEPMALAVGISSGMACVGNIGSDQRYSYTAIGKTVNLAARIEGACRDVDYDIVVTRALAEASGMAWLPAGAFELKGISAPVELCVIVGDASLAEAAEFKELVEIVEVLIGDQTDAQARVMQFESAHDLAAKIEPGLASFLAALQQRANMPGKG